MIDCDNFQQLVKHLELQFANHQSLDPTLPTLIQEVVAESVIQRFETSYGCPWRAVKRYLFIGRTRCSRSPEEPKIYF